MSEVPSFELESTDLTAPGEIVATFASPCPSGATEDRCWLTVVLAAAEDAAYGVYNYVPDGAMEMRLPIPRAAGAYELRLHSGYPRMNYNVEHRVAITVGPPAAIAAPALAVALESNAIVAEFDAPVASPAHSRFWVALVAPTDPDEAYGTWKYVEDGASETRLPLPVMGGELELRLHGDFPAQRTNVVARQAVIVPSRSRPEPLPSFVAATSATPGSELEVRFSSRVSSREGDRAWMTIAPVWSEDVERGEGRFVPDGAERMGLTVPTQPGAYEVRLHSHHPVLAYRVEQRSPLDVE